MKLKYVKNIKRIITHGNCPDGMASAILLYAALGIKPEFHFHGTDEFENLEVTPNTLFCDICPPKHLVDAFVEADGVVLDHHKGVQDLVAQFNDRGVFADEKENPGVSGALLAYREVFKPSGAYGFMRRSACDFAEMAGVRDTWQKSDERWLKSCHQASALTFYSLDYWMEKIRKGAENGETKTFDFIEEMRVGKTIFDNRMKKARVAAKDAFITQVGDMNVAIFNDQDRLTSDVSEVLREDGVNLISGFYYSQYSSNSASPMLCYSLRSDGTFDVKEFAKSLEGGGHSKAAGYRKRLCMNDDPFSLFLNDLRVYVSK
jgi:oligoribonuclease NrnB/cAMP/cGMP phosphodiesterase (DHH superfamily)